MKFIACGLLVMSASLPVLATAADTLVKIRQTGTVTLAYRESPPFSYTDENKQIVGYSMAVCLKMVDALRRELKLPNLAVAYLPVDSATRFPAIMEGKADLECGSTTNNADRRSRVGFAIPHFYSSVRMLVKTNTGIKNWTDLKNRTIAITKSTTTVDLLNERNSIRSLNIKVVEGKDDYDSFSMIDQGKADAFPMDDVLLYSLKATAKNPSSYTVVGEPLSIEPYSIMLRKDDAAFKKIIDSELIRLVDTREIYKIYDYWFTSASGPKGTNMSMPMGYLLRDSLKYPSDRF
ncbi:MAG: amino acid ABC transporter substrate-binding protein [Herminiimonas sp.]|nr:amino acid ABC transporter substrate-binding protein [Herminiimonas sp.]